MNIFNKFMSLKTWQKLGIGIALLTIFKYLSMNGFIINVKAESYTNPNIIISDSITGNNYNGQILEYGRYKSNWLTQEQLNVMYNFGNSIYGGWRNRDYWAFISNNDNLMKETNSTTTNLTEDLIANFENRTGQTGYYRGFQWIYRTPGKGSVYSLQKDHLYTFVFEFYTQNCEWNSASYTKEAFNIYGGYATNKNTTTNSLWDIATLQDITVYTPGMTYTNPNYGYVVISFYMDPNLYPTDNTINTIYLEWLGVSLKNEEYNVDDQVDMNTYKYLFKSSNGGNYRYTGIYILDDVDVYIGDMDSTGPLGGTYLNQTLYKTCDTLDIGCHIENIFRGVKSFTDNLLYNLKMLFSNIFLPNMTIINNEIEATKSTFNNKFPILNTINDYFQQAIDRFNALQPLHEFTFNGVKVPGYNTWLIEPFTFDFDDIIENQLIAPWYSFVRTIITVFLMIGWFYLSHNIISSIVYNTRATIDIERG